METIVRRADLVWICRPERCERFLHIVREHSAVPIICDMIDLHFAREKRRVEVEGGRSDLVIPTIHDIQPHEHFHYDVRSGVSFVRGYVHTPMSMRLHCVTGPA